MKVKPFRCHCIMGFIGKHCGARSLIWKLRKILDSTNYWPLESDLILNPQWKKLFLCHCITVYRFSKVSIFEVLIPLIFILCCHFNSLLLLGLFVRIILNFGAVWIHHDYVFLTFRADLLQNWKKIDLVTPKSVKTSEALHYISGSTAGFETPIFVAKNYKKITFFASFLTSFDTFVLFLHATSPTGQVGKGILLRLGISLCHHWQSSRIHFLSSWKL